MKTLLTLAITSLALGHSALAQTPQPLPTLAKLKVPALSADAGALVATGETYLLAGSPTSSSATFPATGNVLVFRVSDGTFVRKLVSPTPVDAGHFGKSVAVYGGIGYVGAPGESPSSTTPFSGAVHAFDLATGKRLWTAPGRANQKLGSALSVSGDRIAVGGPTGNLSGGPTGSGSVGILDRKTAAELRVISMPSPVANDAFGTSVALQGNLLAAGAPARANGAFAAAGLVQVSDISTGAALRIIGQANAQANASYGAAVAFTTGCLVVSAPLWDNGGATDYGAVYLYNRDGTARPQWGISTQHSDKNFGRQLATCGTLVLISGVRNDGKGQAFLGDVHDLHDVTEITAPADGTFGPELALSMTDQALVIGDKSVLVQSVPGDADFRGGLFLGRSPRQPIDPAYRYGKTNEPAVGAGGALYASFAEATLLEDNGVIMFRAGLKGTGVTTANNSAVFNDWSTNTPELILRKGDKVGTKTVTVLGKMFFTPTSSAWPVIQTAIGGASKIFHDDGTNIIPGIGAGSTATNANIGGTVGTIRAITTAANETATVTMVYDAKTGVDGTTTANDSHIAIYNQAAMTHVDFIREGNASPEAGRTFGQIQPRIAAGKAHFVFAATLSGDTATNTAVILRKTTGNNTIVAQKGKTAPGTGSTFSTFIGEGVNGIGTVLLRATTSAGAEGLWMKTEMGSLTNVMLKGTAAPGTATGVKFSKVTRYFVDDANTVLFSALLTGPGVTTANDQALWLLKGGSLSLLLREGDAAPGCGSARVGSITALDLSTKNGYYSILTSLTGSTASNQAAFYGDTNKATTAERQPELNLRKGAWIDKTGGQRITALSLGALNIDPRGSGSTGTVRLVCDYGALIRTTYSDNVQELLCKIP